MKRRVIIKTTGQPQQVAHLYEHLFCHTLSRLLRRNGQFEGVDYMLHGSTYPGGLIIIYFTALREGIDKALDAVTDMPFDLTAIDNLDELIAELGAEEQAKATYDRMRLVSDLEEIHHSTWQPFEKFGSFNLRGGRKSSPALKLTYLAKAPSTLTCEFSVDPIVARRDQTHLPLAVLLLEAIRYAVADELVTSKFYYYDDDTNHTKGTDTRIAAHFVRPYGTPRGLDDELHICKQLMKELLDANFTENFVRLVGQLAIHSRASYAMEETARYTGVFVGREGLLELTSKENVLMLLKHTLIRVKVRGEQQSFQIAELLS